MDETFSVCISITDGFTGKLHVAFNQTHVDAEGEHHASQSFHLPSVANGQDCLQWLQQALAMICDAV